ncbi:hypothetical protein DD595_25805, partial [Enterobacter cloacae complex sp. 4DZ3-17B2]
MEITHRAGALNVVPDVLSRMYENGEEALGAIGDDADPWYTQKISNIREFPSKYPNWRIEDGRIYYHRPHPVIESAVTDQDAWKLVIPAPSRPRAMSDAHDCPQSGHLGVDKTYHRLIQDFYWLG